MAIPTSPISLANLQLEFGGATPIRLNEYYKGGPYVSTSVAQVPVSGAISLGNFSGVTNVYDPYETLLYVWTNRASLFRGPNATSIVWLGDTFGQNNFYERYVSSSTATGTFSNSGLQSYGNNCTVVVWAAGSDPSLTSVTISNSLSATAQLVYGPNNAGDGSFSVYQVNAPMPAVTQISETWSRINDNTGSWPGFFILPGLWDIRLAQAGVATSTTMPRGEISVFFRPSVGDGLGYVPSTGISTDINWSSFWYNSYGVQINVNTTNGSLTYTSGLDTSYRCFFLEKVG